MTEKDLITLIREYFDEYIEELACEGINFTYADCCQLLYEQLTGDKETELNFFNGVKL